jgi:protein phosphatase
LLLQALGTRSTIEPIISDRHLRRGDRILLCSDGLHGSIPDHQISEILLATTDINDCTRTLIRAALAAGGPDNVTVIVADCV